MITFSPKSRLLWHVIYWILERYKLFNLQIGRENCIMHKLLKVNTQLIYLYKLTEQEHIHDILKCQQTSSCMAYKARSVIYH